jgi:hypothetical protein
MCLLGLICVVLASACVRNRDPIQTDPYPVSPTAPVISRHLQIPPEFDVVGAQYAMTTLTDVLGDQISTASRAQSREFISVYAIRRATKEKVLLVYEDVAHRPQPIEIITLDQRPPTDSMP